jgi:RNA ligase
MSGDHLAAKRTERWARNVTALTAPLDENRPYGLDDYERRLAGLPAPGAPDAEYRAAGRALAAEYHEARQRATDALLDMNCCMWLTGDLLVRWIAERGQSLARGDLTAFVKAEAEGWGFSPEAVWQWYIAARQFRQPEERAQTVSIYTHAEVAMAAGDPQEAAQRMDVVLGEGMSTTDVRRANALVKRGLMERFGKPPELALDARGNVWSRNGDGYRPLFTLAEGADPAAVHVAKMVMRVSSKEPIDMEPPIVKMERLASLVVEGETDWKRYGDVKAVYRDGLVLFNYTPAAQSSGRWNWFERVCRGLILDCETGEVVARPFDKFFNWGEGGRATNARLVEVTEKLDGSLGILYRHRGEQRIATRGSFDGEQALWATELLKRFDLAGLPQQFTLLFEIIYPGNRVVVDYGALEDLVLTGVRNRFSGQDLPYPAVKDVARRCGFSVVPAARIESVEQALALAGKLEANREGWVLRFADGQRFKVKGDAYRELHRLLCGLSKKRVHQAMVRGLLDELLDTIPDGFLREAQQWREEIETQVEAAVRRVARAFAGAPKGTRKEFALWVRDNHPQDAPYLFAALDGRDVRDLILRREFQEH